MRDEYPSTDLIDDDPDPDSTAEIESMTDGGSNRDIKRHDHSDVGSGGDEIRPNALGGGITDSTDITSIVGDGISISGGELTATQGESPWNFVDIDEHGGDPSGETASDTALQNAIDALSDYSVLVMTDGNYVFDDDDYRINHSHCIVLGTGSQFEIYGSERSGAQSFLSFRASLDGKISTPTDTLQADAVDGSQSIVVSDGTQFSKGDEIVINYDPDETSHSLTVVGGAAQRARTSRATIRYIDGDRLYLNRSLGWDHRSGSYIWRFTDTIEGSGFVNMHVVDSGGDEDDGDDAGGMFLSLYGTRECFVRNCRTDTVVTAPFCDYFGYANVWEDCYFYDPDLPQRDSSHWEPFRLRGTTDCTLIRPTAQRARRGIDLQGGNHGLEVVQPRLYNVYLQGFSPHSSKGNPVAYDARIRGGIIEAEAERPDHSKIGSASAVSTTPDIKRLEIIGTTLRGGSYCITTPYGTASNIHCEHVTFEDLPAYNSTVLLGADMDGARFVNCHFKTNNAPIQTSDPSNVHFENCHYENQGANITHIFDHFDANNIRISGWMDGANPTSFPCRFRGVDNLRIDLDAEFSEHSFIRLYGCSNVYVTGNYDIGRSIVVFSSTAIYDTMKNLVVENCRHIRNQGGSTAVFLNDDDNPTVQDVRVLDCHLPDTDIALDNDPIEGVWVWGNTANAISQHTDSEVIKTGSAHNRLTE